MDSLIEDCIMIDLGYNTIHNISSTIEPQLAIDINFNINNTNSNNSNNSNTNNDRKSVCRFINFNSNSNNSNTNRCVCRFINFNTTIKTESKNNSNSNNSNNNSTTKLDYTFTDLPKIIDIEFNDIDNKVKSSTKIEFTIIKINSKTFYKCNICGYKVAYKSQIYSHRYVHNKRFICNKRGFIFINNKHMSIHKCKETYYSCNICGIKYIVESSYKDHMLCH